MAQKKMYALSKKGSHYSPPSDAETHLSIQAGVYCLLHNREQTSRTMGGISVRCHKRTYVLDTVGELRGGGFKEAVEEVGNDGVSS